MPTRYIDKYNLTGRLAVITGGGRGIGLTCAEALAQMGAQIIILERDESIGADGVAKLVAQGAKADWRLVDVTDDVAVRTAAEEIEREIGPVDCLVCCAGVAISGVPAEKATPADWRRVIDINLNGVFWACQAFGRFMLERGRGSIVNIGSMSGFIVNKPQEQASYNASKAAVHHLTKSLAVEWAGRGVRVNAVAPTYIDTPLTRFGMENDALRNTWIEMTPMGRVGQPDEIASVVLFLVSEAASLLTGSIILADAGYTAW